MTVGRSELWVSAASMCLIATTLTPLAKRSLAARNASTCLSNVRQIGRALLLYSGDSEGAFPGPFESDPVGGGDSRVRPYDGAIMPYVGAKEVFHCPSDDLPRKNDTFWDGRYREDRPPRSYAIVDRIVTGRSVVRSLKSPLPDATTGVYGRNSSTVEAPDATVSIAERWPYMWRGVSVSGVGSFPSHTLAGCDTWALAGRPADSVLDLCAAQYGDAETLPTRGHDSAGNYAMAGGGARSLPWRSLAAHDFDAFRVLDHRFP